MCKAILLAGSREDYNDSPLTSEDTNNKAFVPIHGRPMLNYIVDAINQVDIIDEVIIVGPQNLVREKIPQFTGKIIPEEGLILDNLLTAVNTVNLTEHVLVITSDIPLVTKEALEDFLHNCRGDYDLFYPVINKEDSEKKYPKANRTYVKLTEGKFTGGNVFYVNPNIISPCYNMATELILHRKSPFRLALNFGFGFVFNFLRGKLGLEQVERQISDILSIKAKVVHTTYPELGIDIDKESDLELAKNILKSEQAHVREFV